MYQEHLFDSGYLVPKVSALEWDDNKLVLIHISCDSISQFISTTHDECFNIGITLITHHGDDATATLMQFPYKA